MKPESLKACPKCHGDWFRISGFVRLQEFRDEKRFLLMCRDCGWHGYYWYPRTGYITVKKKK